MTKSYKRTNWHHCSAWIVLGALLLALFVPAAYGQQAEWTRQFGTAGRDSAAGVAADASGIYIVGANTFRKYDAAGNLLWSIALTGIGISLDASGVYISGEAGNDAFVGKYDLNGTFLWMRQFGSSQRDTAWGVSADATGVYVAGGVYNGGALPGQVSAGAQDVFVRKYDSDGDEVWTRQFGGSQDEQAEGVFANGSGVYAVGFTKGTLPGYVSAGGEDVIIRKYDAAGNAQWTHQFGTAAHDEALEVFADASGVYVAGFFGPTGFLRKYDANGNEVWTRQFLSRNYGVTGDSSGVYVTGGVHEALPGFSYAGNGDTFVRKYDVTGNEQWTFQFGAATHDQPEGVAVNSSGVYVAGLVEDGGTLPGQISAGGTDGFLVKIQPPGPAYTTEVQPPIDPDGSSVFSYRRGTIPVKFTLSVEGSPTCDLPPATISLYRTSGTSPGLITEADYVGAADSGSSFRIADCQYVYNLNASSLGIGIYEVKISIDSSEVGSATFGLN